MRIRTKTMIMIRIVTRITLEMMQVRLLPRIASHRGENENHDEDSVLVRDPTH